MNPTLMFQSSSPTCFLSANRNDVTWDPIAFSHLYNGSICFIGDEGYDYQTGYGLINAEKAVAVVVERLKSHTVDVE